MTQINTLKKNSKLSLRKVINKIQNGKNFIISAHMNLEGDALGSELAVYTLLKKLGKKAVVYNQDKIPKVYTFLPYHKVIKNDFKGNEFDTAIVLDCSDISRTGSVKDCLGKADCVINIDHHTSNTFFGDINLVEPRASSACEIVYKLCDKMGIMDKNIALCLYTGIFTDTGSFIYTSTSSDTHRIISKLMKYNVHPYAIYEKIHSSCGEGDLKFIARVISSLQFDARRKICWSEIKLWKSKDYDLTEVIFSIMRLLEEVEVFILFKKVKKDEVRVNFRSCSKIDVNKIAQFFGGGGHKRASGTTVKGNINSIEAKVISFVEKYTDRLKP